MECEAFLSNFHPLIIDMGDESPDLILMAAGSEVSLILAAGERLAAEGINARIVSYSPGNSSPSRMQNTAGAFCRTPSRPA
jgi:transketolase